MPEGNSVETEPKPKQETQQQLSMEEAAEQDSNPPETIEGLKAEIAVLKEKYSNSSREAHRLLDELKEIKGTLQKNKEEQKQKPQVEGLAPETDHVKWWVTEGDKTEKEARAEYKRDQWFDARLRQMEMTIGAVQNMIRFEHEMREKSAGLEPEMVRKASEFFKDIPELETLPIAEKVERYRKVTEKIAPQISGRDLSQMKAAAGGSTGSGGARSLGGGDAELDAQAKRNGFPSWKALQEFNRCTTANEYAALKRKYNMK